jgi:hypothetical protein
MSAATAARDLPASQMVSAVAAERAAIVARRSTELYAAFISANDVLTRLA